MRDVLGQRDGGAVLLFRLFSCLLHRIVAAVHRLLKSTCRRPDCNVPVKVLARLQRLVGEDALLLRKLAVAVRTRPRSAQSASAV